MTDYQDWVGKRTVDRQVAEMWPLRGLAAVLDKPFTARVGDPIPRLGHWCYFAPTVPQSQIGPDGHPARGDFIPPLPQPRRMWAASDIAFSAPIRFGDTVEKTAEIASLTAKEGGTGTLVFLEIRHTYTVDDTPCVTETQTIVYRDPPASGEAPAAKPAPADPTWSVGVDTDPTRLFRYSAVTFNAHRIHFDRPYTTDEEGYPGVIVQGQFIATMLLEAFEAAHPGAPVRRFGFRALKPIFSGERFWAEGRVSDDGPRLWARGADGDLRLSATVAL